MKGCDFANSLVTAADIRSVDKLLDKVRQGLLSDHSVAEQSVCSLVVLLPLHAVHQAWCACMPFWCSITTAA
jgi:hypothetical protein